MTQLNLPVSLRSLRWFGKRSSPLQVFHQDHAIAEARRSNPADMPLKIALVMLYAAIVGGAIATGTVNMSLVDLHQWRVMHYFMVGAGIYGSVMLVVTIVRVILAMFYKAMPSLSDEQLPFVTVIIPAYNEGPDVAKSIESIARCDYPRHKLQIITINDGSKDDTWHHMSTAAAKYPDNVCAINMEKNGGKRQGLRVGFALAAGDVIVTMDSDSVIEHDALRNLVTPIAADSRVGGVAGNVKVLNRSQGIIPRMLRASFVIAFDFSRAYQSVIRTVQCTPGAFSAYRRSAVEEVLEEWNNQSWMGKPSTIAEDRALSNLILRQGHEILFQSNAVVWTNIPTTYNGLAKMFMRWERGNLRENLAWATWCYTPFRKRFWLSANLDWALNSLEMILPYVVIATFLVYGLFNPLFMLRYLAVATVFSALMQIYYIKQERNSDWVYGILYSLFWFTCMWWVVPYSVLTASNGSWMTRTLPATAGAAAPATAAAPARIAA